MYNQEQYSGQQKPGGSGSKLWILIVAVVLGFACISTTVIGGCVAAIVIPNFMKARSQGQLAACESNIKNIATALEMYATDNNMYYPPSLDYLTEGRGTYGAIMKNLPVCPSCQKSYTYTPINEEENHDYILECSEANVHLNTGNVGEGNFPQYKPGKGLILK